MPAPEEHSPTVVVTGVGGEMGMLERDVEDEHHYYTEDSEEEGAISVNNKNTSLLRASANGKLDCVSRLLTEGADINSKDPDGDTPLILSSLNNYLDVVKLLIDVGCDINLTGDNRRSTALHMAVWGRRQQIVRMLIKAGCDVTIRDRNNDNPIMLCVRRGYADILEELLKTKNCEVNAGSTEQETALHYAARYGQPECARLLLQHVDIDREAINIWKVTPFLLALMHGNGDVAMVMMEAGCSIQARGASQKTALHYAVGAELGQSVRALILNGIDLDTKDADGRDALLQSVEQNLPGMVKILIQAGSQLNTKGKATVQQKYKQFTPLEVAVFKGFLDIAKMLFYAGAPVGDLINLNCQRYKELGIVIRNDSVADWMTDNIQAPLSLLDSSRAAIREALAPGTQQRIHHLPLPGTIKIYLLCEDFGYFPEMPEFEPKRVFSRVVV